MKNLIKKLRDKKGSGIMTVMLAITFLTAFGTLALYLSYTSFQVSVSDRASKEVTLNAATCMDEIKAGLQDIVSDAIKETYKEVMPNYISKGFEIQKDFSRHYFEYVANGVGNDSVEDGSYLMQIPESNGVYSDGLYYADTGVGDDGEPEGSANTLASLIKEHRGYQVTVTPTGVPKGSLSGVAEILYDENDESEDPMPVGIILKGVKVTVTSDKLNRSSSVTADIRIGVPNIGYSLSPYTLAGIPEFVFICSDELKLSGSGSYTNCDILGSAYAGKVAIEGNNTRMRVASNSVLIAKENIAVNGTSTSQKFGSFNVDRNSTLWAGNITLGDRFHTGSSAKLLGKTFVQNDLVFAGPKSYAQLGNSYKGFGISESDYGHASSIYSVGKGSDIDFDNNLHLTLAGVTYLVDSASYTGRESGQIVSTESDAMGGAYRTGQSEYSYFDNLLYFAPYGSIEKRVYRSDFPDQFNSDGNLLYLKQNNGHIVVYYKDTGTYKYGVYKENIDFASIEDWSNPEDFLDWIDDEEFDPSTEDTDLEPGQSKMAVFTKEEFNKIYEFRLKSDYIEELGKNYSDYGATLHPYYKWHTDNEVIVYFYLKFDTPEHANQYFIDYFDTYVRSGNNRIINRINSYWDIIPETTGKANLQSAVGSWFENGKPTMGDPENYASMAEQLRQEAQVLERMFYMYCKTLSNVDAELSDEELEALDSPFDYYVNKAAVNELLPEGSAKDEEYFYSKNKGVAVISRKGEFVYTGTGDQKDLCLILATGDVKVNASFKGLIICDGNITVGSSCTFTNNAINVVMSFTSETTDLPEGENRQLKEFFNIDFTEIYTESVSGSGDAWNVAKLVGFDTWVRE